MYLLGVNLTDYSIVHRALRSFYGINYALGQRICARLQIHSRCRIRDLTEAQISALSAFISQPSSTPAPLRCRRPALGYVPVPLSQPAPAVVRSKKPDRVGQVKLETELRGLVRENIAHHREIGTYVGKRHAMHYPVRGQGTRSNALTARRLNRVDRAGFATWAAEGKTALPSGAPSRVFASIRHVFWSRRPA